MNTKFYKDVESKEFLGILVDENGNVVWSSGKSPVSNLYKAYFRGKLLDLGNLTMYANQAGLAMAVLADKINMKKCVAVQLSEVGKKMFEDKNIPVEYAEIIPLVISSQDPTSVCPIEKFLSEHDDPTVQWDFLEERYTGDNAPTCCAKK